MSEKRDWVCAAIQPGDNASCQQHDALWSTKCPRCADRLRACCCSVSDIDSHLEAPQRTCSSKMLQALGVGRLQHELWDGMNQANAQGIGNGGFQAPYRGCQLPPLSAATHICPAQLPRHQSGQGMS